MMCKCERPGPTRLRVFGSDKTVRVAHICERCYQASIPPELCAVTALTIQDVMFQMRRQRQEDATP